MTKIHENVSCWNLYHPENLKFKIWKNNFFRLLDNKKEKLVWFLHYLFCLQKHFYNLLALLCPNFLDIELKFLAF